MLQIRRNYEISAISTIEKTDIMSMRGVVGGDETLNTRIIDLNAYKKHRREVEADRQKFEDLYYTLLEKYEEETKADTELFTPTEAEIHSN